MAMDGDRMAQAIADALDAAGFYDDTDDPATTKAESLATLGIICGEIVAEIANNAEVASGIDVAHSVDLGTKVGETIETGTVS